MEIFDPGAFLRDSPEIHRPAAATTRFKLSELAEDYEFFNHGLFFTKAMGLRFPDDDPAGGWQAKQMSVAELILQPFDAPVFDGIEAYAIGDRLTWDHVVCAVRKHDWPELLRELAGVVVIDHESKRFAQAGYASLEVLDPVFVERRSRLDPEAPKIVVNVFGVDANDGQWLLQPAIEPLGVPGVHRYAPRQATAAYGARVLRDPTALAERINPANWGFLREYQRIAEAGPSLDYRSENEDQDRRR